MIKDVNIKVSRETRMVYLDKTVIGNDNENLQGNIVFSFKDEFVDGQGRLEYRTKEERGYVLLEKVDETYQIPVKSVLTKEGQVDMQLVITEGTDSENIPIFKSNVFYVYCNSSINVNPEEPSEYSGWLDIANTKLNEFEELTEEINEKVENGDFNGATFTPSVDDEGNLSWENDKGLENPEVKNIRGKEGLPGKDGENGKDGKNATINGLEAIKIAAGENVAIVQQGDTFYISSTGGSMKAEVVESLPEVGEEGIMYLVAKESPKDDIYDEYLYVNGVWELIGTTAIDMTDYYKKSEVDALLGNLENLPTEDKSNLVASLIELFNNTPNIPKVKKSEIYNLTEPTMFVYEDDSSKEYGIGYFYGKNNASFRIYVDNDDSMAYFYWQNNSSGAWNKKIKLGNTSITNNTFDNNIVVGTDIKGYIGERTKLSTEDKSNLVNAINELNSKFGDIDTVLSTLTTVEEVSE